MTPNQCVGFQLASIRQALALALVFLLQMNIWKVAADTFSFLIGCSLIVDQGELPGLHRLSLRDQAELPHVLEDRPQRTAHAMSADPLKHVRAGERLAVLLGHLPGPFDELPTSLLPVSPCLWLVCREL